MFKAIELAIPLIDDIIISIEKSMYAITLDLSMEYYAIILNKILMKYCVSILPWFLMSIPIYQWD